MYSSYLLLLNKLPQNLGFETAMIYYFLGLCGLARLCWDLFHWGQPGSWIRLGAQLGQEHPRSWTHMFGTSAGVTGMAGSWLGLSHPKEITSTALYWLEYGQLVTWQNPYFEKWGIRLYLLMGTVTPRQRDGKNSWKTSLLTTYCTLPFISSTHYK
jgi:hypothetical protein